MIERRGSPCIAKYAWVVVRLASYSCKMLPLQSSFKLQCICLSHKIFHFEATMRGKPFENVGVPAEFSHTLQNIFAEVAYLSKLQDIFPQVAKSICRKALKKCKLGSPEKVKEGLASEPLIKTYLLKLQSVFVQTAKYICKIGQIFQSHGRQGSASEGVGGKRPGRCEPLLPVTASKTIGQCPPKPWHIHTWAKVGNTETQKYKYITLGPKPHLEPWASANQNQEKDTLPEF